MRRPSLRRIFRFGLLSTLIASACVVAASSSLASDAAGYLAGETIEINGGMFMD